MKGSMKEEKYEKLWRRNYMFWKIVSKKEETERRENRRE